MELLNHINGHGINYTCWLCLENVKMIRYERQQECLCRGLEIV